MTAPICVACKVRMVRSKTGIDVELMAGAEPYQIWNADLYRCPSCDFKVVSGFGVQPVAEHFQRERYAQFLKAVTLRFWNTLKEMKQALPDQPGPFCERSYAYMAASIAAIREELKRRNPIGVNMYTDYLDQAEAAVREISAAEADNPTGDEGPTEPKRLACNSLVCHLAGMHLPNCEQYGVRS